MKTLRTKTGTALAQQAGLSQSALSLAERGFRSFDWRLLHHYDIGDVMSKELTEGVDKLEEVADMLGLKVNIRFKVKK